MISAWLGPRRARFGFFFAEGVGVIALMPVPPPPSPSSNPGKNSGFSWLGFIGGMFGPWTIFPVFIYSRWAPYGIRSFLALLVLTLIGAVAYGIARKSWAFCIGLLSGIALIAAVVALKSFV